MGIVRFEVSAPREDKELVRRLAQSLSAQHEDVAELRKALRELAGAKLDDPGSIWRTLRGSPLVGSGLRLGRDRRPGRKVEL